MINIRFSEKQFKPIVLFLLMLMSGLRSSALPCMPGWEYRMPVEIEYNGTATLHNHQVLISSLNTAYYISNGKMQQDGSDIRFYDQNNNLLPHWFDPGTFNSSSPGIWVQLSELQPGNDTIWLFYGNPDADNTANAQETFMFYDDFSASLDQWNIYGNGAYSLENNTLVLESGKPDTERMYLETKHPLHNAYWAEMEVVSLTGNDSTMALIGQVDSQRDGYAINYKHVQTPVPVEISILRNNPVKYFERATSNGDAFINNTANTVWQCAWINTASIKGIIGGDDVIITDNSSVHTCTDSLHIGISLLNAEAEMKIKWVRARKYAAVTPVTDPIESMEEETNYPSGLTTGSNSPLCQGDTLTLWAETKPGATYQWHDPQNNAIGNTVSITIENPESGVYTLNVTVPGSECGTEQYTEHVVVNALTRGGNITGAQTVCEGDNTGTLELQNYTGDIMRWEYSTTGSDPWTTISNNTFRQVFEDINQTMAYRAVVQSGVCESQYSSPATVTVNANPIAGTANGPTVICRGQQAEMSLEGHQGDIIWMKSIDQANWISTGESTASFTSPPLDTTTWYKALVSNGVCTNAESNAIRITVNEPSEAGSFESDTLCAGSSTSLTLHGNTGNVIRWENSLTGGGPWNTISDTAKSLDIENITQTTWYRAVVQNPGCKEALTNGIPVIVEQPVETGTISGTDTICYGEPGAVAISGYTDTLVNWQYSTDQGGSWQTTSHDQDTLVYTNLHQTTLYRALLQTRHNTCPQTPSDIAVITVSPLPVSGSVDGNRFLCGGDHEEVLHLLNYTGNVTRWEQSQTGREPWEMIHNSTDSLEFYDILETTYYRAVVSTPACSPVKTDSVKIMITDPSIAGSIAGSATVCEANNEGSLTLTGYTGDVQAWEKSTDRVQWQSTPFVNPTILEYNNLQDTTWFRAIVKNGICKSDTSSVASVKTMPLPVPDFTADTVEAGAATTFNNLSVIPAGSMTGFDWDFGNGYSSTSKHPVYQYPEPGAYNVKLTVASNHGCIDTTIKKVIVNPKPQAGFEFSNVCHYDSARFINQSQMQGGVAGYLWKFGDGNTSTAENPAYAYQAPGVYDVTLTAYSNVGTVDSITKTIEIYQVPVSDFTFENTCAGNPVMFTNHSNINGGSLTYYWKLSDQRTSSAINPEYRYDSAGHYDVRLIATSNHQCKDTLVKTIIIHPNPVAEFHTEHVPYKDMSVFYDSSRVAGGTIEQWIWDFDDGTSSSQQHPQHMYEAPGQYDVELTIVTDSGCAGSVQQLVKIFALPNASFTANNVCEGDSIIFRNTSEIYAGNLYYEWHLGDQNTSTAKHPVHLYEASGNYEVTLFVVSGEGASDTISKQVTVYPNPVPDFLAPGVCDGYPTHFENQSSIATGTIQSYTWDFGDGTNSIQEAPVKQYLNPGVYDVNLTAVSDKGCETSMVQQAIVRKIPVANFTVDNVCLDTKARMQNLSSAETGTLTYHWDFGDTNTSILQHPAHQYNTPATYPVKLTVKSDMGCADSLIRYVVVYALPDVNAGNDTTISKGFGITLDATGGIWYDWYPGEGLDDPGIATPRARPMETTTYTVRVEDEHKCENKDSITIYVNDDHKIIPNNVITPDGNGINDVWKITNIDAYEDATIHIFNRWGEEVFTKKGYLDEWDGKNTNGDILPDGTYYYVIRFENGNKHYSGAITLLRNK